MRILHVVLSRGFAGTERSTAEMCNAHCAAHEVTLVVKRGHRRRGGESIVDFVDRRVRIVEVSNWWPSSGLRRAIDSTGPDVIHAHLRKSTRLLARLKPPCPTIATLHMWVNGPHFLEMDGIIVIAQWQKRDLATYRGRVFDIEESLIPHRRLSEEEIAALRAELGVLPGEFLIGGVGRLARSKGFDTLIRAFERAALSNCRLVIVGGGRELERLQRLAGPGVELVGFRENAKDYYQAFDLFVSPSRSEPLGRVILEAFDAGTPVLATRTQGATEILGKYPGRLVPIDDEEAMAQALRELSAERPERVSYDLSPYYLESVAARTLTAYEELIAARQALP